MTEVQIFYNCPKELRDAKRLTMFLLRDILEHLDKCALESAKSDTSAEHGDQIVFRREIKPGVKIKVAEIKVF